MEKQSKGPYVFLIILIGIVFILSLLISIIMPPLIIVAILSGIFEYFIVKKIKSLSIEKNNIDKEENVLLEKGYKKICDGFFINEQTKYVNILNKEYKFSQIVDCELIENTNSINSAYEKTKGKIKNNGKLKSSTTSFSTETEYCSELYINITVDDFRQPNIKLNVRANGLLTKNSSKYKIALDNANQLLATLKLIISRNNNI